MKVKKEILVERATTRALCEEWRNVHLNPPELLLEPWEKEVSGFTGSDSLSGEAWARLREWYKARDSK